MLYREVQYANVQLVFDEKYDSEDLFAARGALIVTARLFEALRAADLEGFVPIRTTLTTARYYRGSLKRVPPLLHLAPLGHEVDNIAIAWRTRARCPRCGHRRLVISSFDPDTIDAATAANRPPLKVVARSWRGADLFRFSQHPELGVTQRFADVLREFRCPQLQLVPATWVDLPGHRTSRRTNALTG